MKPGSGSAAAHAAAVSFILALARRRLQTAARRGEAQPRILYCAARNATGEAGRLNIAGLTRFGIDPAALLLVDARRDSEVLWVLEEALRSATLHLVIGCLDAIKLTPARRLSLAAKEGSTPALLLTRATMPASAAMASRWAIDPAPGTPHPFDPRAPGTARLAVTLQRCRATPAAGDEPPLTLEWSDASFRFRVAAPLADRAARPAHPWRRAG